MRFRLGWMLAILGVSACSPQPTALRVANGGDITMLDPQHATSAADGRLMRALHAGLTRLDPVTLEVLPDLAAAFGAVDGGRQWWFALRPGLRWSDGQPLTLDQVAASWLQLQDPATGAPYGEWLRGAGIRIEQERLWVDFAEPQPRFGEMCAWHALAPRPPASVGLEVGSGPYRLRSRRIRDRVVVEANPYYWNAARVSIPRIEFLTIESQFTALNLFLAGELDYLPNVPALTVTALQREHPAEFRPAPQYASTFLRFNTTRPPFDRLEVRRAFAAAVDQEALCATLQSGRRALHHLVPPGVPDWSPPALPTWLATPPPLPNWLKDGVELLFPSSELNRDLAEILQQQWHLRLGVAVRLVNQESKTFYAAQRGLDYQLSRSSWIADYLDPISFLEIFTSTSGNNRTGWQDPLYDQAVARARQAVATADRFRALAEAEARLLDQAVIVPLYQEASLELVSPRLRGFHRNLRGYLDWAAMSLAEPESDA